MPTVDPRFAVDQRSKEILEYFGVQKEEDLQKLSSTQRDEIIDSLVAPQAKPTVQEPTVLAQREVPTEEDHDPLRQFETQTLPFGAEGQKRMLIRPWKMFVTVPTDATEEDTIRRIRKKYPNIRPSDLEWLEPGMVQSAPRIGTPEGVSRIRQQQEAPGGYTDAAGQRAWILGNQYDLVVSAERFDSPVKYNLIGPSANLPSEKASILQEELRREGNGEPQIRIFEDPQSPGQVSMLAKRPGDTQWREVDPPWAPFDPKADIPRMAVGAGKLAFEMYIATRGGASMTKGIPGVLQRSLNLGAGVAGTEILESAAQRVVRPEAESEPWSQVAVDALYQGAFAGAASLLGEPLAPLGRSFAGGKPNTETMQNLRLSADYVDKELGINLLVAANADPSVSSMLGMAVQTSGAVAEKSRNNLIAGANAFHKMVERLGDPSEMSTKQLVKAFDRASAKMLNAAGRTPQPLSGDGAAQLSAGWSGMVRWIESGQRKIFNNTYEQHVLHGTEFNAAPVHALARKSRVGTPMEQVAEQEIGPGGVPIIDAATQRVKDQSYGGTVGEYQKFLDDLLSTWPGGRVRTQMLVDDRGEPVVASSLEQLHAFRKRADILAGRLVGRPARDMNDIVRELDRIMQNPSLNGNEAATAEFVRGLSMTKKWRTLESRVATHKVYQLEREHPEVLVDYMLGSGNSDRIKAFHDLATASGDRATWTEAKNHWYARLWNEPTTALKKIDSIKDENARRLLISVSDEKSLREFVAWDRSLTTHFRPLYRKAQESENMTASLLEAIYSKNDAMVSSIWHNADGETQNMLRSGVFKQVWNKATLPATGRAHLRMINPKAAVEEVERIKKSGAWNTVLTPGDRKLLESIESVMTFWRDTGMGEGLVTAALASGKFLYYKPHTAIAARVRSVRNHLMGELFMNPGYQRMVFRDRAKMGMKGRAFYRGVEMSRFLPQITGLWMKQMDPVMKEIPGVLDEDKVEKAGILLDTQRDISGYIEALTGEGIPTISESLKRLGIGDTQ